jgi:excisionase family DNA binding protein
VTAQGPLALGVLIKVVGISSQQRKSANLKTPNPATETPRNMEEKPSNQIETSATLERKRAKYTVDDVRQLCGGISRSTVMREIRRKRLACYRARRTLRFSEEHITKYLEKVEQGVK